MLIFFSDKKNRKISMFRIQILHNVTEAKIFKNWSQNYAHWYLEGISVLTFV